MTTSGCPRNAGRRLARSGDLSGIPLASRSCFVRAPPPIPPNTPLFSDIRAGALRCQLKVSPRPRAPRNCRPLPRPAGNGRERGAARGNPVLGRSPFPAACAPGRPGRGFLRPVAQRAHRARRQDRRYLQRYRGGQSAHGAADRARRPSRGPRRQDAPARQVRPLQRRLGRDGEQRQFADRRSSLADDRGDPGDRRRCQGRPPADRSPRRRRPAPARRIPALGQYRQHDDQAAQRLHLRGHPRGPRGGNGRQARRPGPGQAR